MNQIIREFEREPRAVGVASNGVGIGDAVDRGAGDVVERQPSFRPTEWIPQFTALVRRHLTAGLIAGADTQVKAHKLGISFDITAAPVKGWIEGRSRWWANTVNDGTEKSLFKVLATGRKEGLGQSEMAKRLRQLREFQTVTRSERVARTEMTVAQGEGSLQAFTQAEVPAKRWYTALDERVRDTHMDAHGQIRKLSEAFSVGGDRMESPGQGSDPAENINCRCVVIPEGMVRG
jgi:SPP1 gp7 family putative phage head morphogenesis protein